MMKRILFLILSFIVSTSSIAQLVVDTNLTPLQLAQGIAGPGVTVSNATFIGSQSMGASFTAAGTNLGIANGIMLATGTATLAIGPNLSTFNGASMGLPGDSILDSLAGTVTHDACILEFDFMPQSSMVTFRYVFGSDEYPEFVCSNYNDVFAFFISGPGIAVPLNMALIAGTGTPVAINVVNPGVVGGSGSAGPHCNLNYSALYVDNTAGSTIELDGFTVPMTATAIVQPCQTYRMRIMIADAFDGGYDSGVFLEAGSLFSNPVVNAGTDQTICSGGTANIGTTASPLYSYNWNPPTGLSSTTAANPTVTLTNSGTTPITATYIVVANSGTCLFTDTVKITVDPAPVATFTINPSQTCEGQTITVDYTGTTAANYTWDFGAATVISGSGSGPYQISYPTAMQDSIFVTANNPGCSGTFAQAVTITPNPVAAFTIPPGACPGEAVVITFTGSASSSANYVWDFGGGTIVSGSGAGPYSVSWPATGSPTISLNIDDNGCLSPIETAQITIGQIPIPFAGNDIAVCSDNQVSLGDVAQPGFNYVWSPSTGLDDPTISNPTATISNTGIDPILNNYVVTITSSGGCTASDDVSITVNPSVNVSFNQPGGKCLNNNSFDFSIQGNYPSTSAFTWDFGSAATPSTSNDAIVSGVTYNAVGIYTVTLNASNANCVMQPVTHTVEIFAEPLADFITDDLEACAPLITDLDNLSSNLTDNFLWQISDGTISSVVEPVFTLNTPGTYDVILTATTINGCSSVLKKDKYLTVYANPVSSFTTQPSIASIETPIIFFQNSSQYADIYSWDFGDSSGVQTENASHIYAATGIYEITLIARNSFGCIDTSRGTIEINEGLSFYIPNAFTPDGDGINDYFQGYGINFKEYEMAIFNRWGDKIYETKEYFKPWDGKVKSVVQNDVYVYKILVKDKMDELHNYVGSVTVIK
jgi:gliding motility-associated-like protein